MPILEGSKKDRSNMDAPGDPSPSVRPEMAKTNPEALTFTEICGLLNISPEDFKVYRESPIYKAKEAHRREFEAYKRFFLQFAERIEGRKKIEKIASDFAAAFSISLAEAIDIMAYAMVAPTPEAFGEIKEMVNTK